MSADPQPGPPPGTPGGPAAAGGAGPVGQVGQVVIGVGVDLCDVGRMRATLARTPGFAARVFTDGERAYCDRWRDPSERYAARFATKEAVLKAMGLGLGACGFHDIEVRRAASGEPSVALHGRAVALAADRGIAAWHLTLSHTHTLAIAQVVAVGAPARQ